MAAYDSLKSLVQQAIRTNGNNEITGQVLQNVLMAMIDELGGENGYAGVATPSTNPGAPDGKVFYFATEAGTYTHFDGATLAKGIHLLVFNGVTWSHQTLYTIDSEVTPGSNNLITSGAVYTKIINAINALDATVSKSAGADGLSLSLTETDGKVTSISGSIAPQTYDAYGAASAARIAASTDATNKVNAAKTQILGDAASDYNTLGKLEDKIQAEASRAAAAESALNTAKADKATTLAGYGINDAYTKTEVNGLVSTPHQNYVTVPTYASLPTTGSADTIYRVSNYNGSTSQVDASVYSEYAWNGSGYTFLRVVSQIGEVFDITVYNSNTKYADLAAALGTNGANVPSSIRKGGMSVKFVQSSDNKYVQYRLMNQNWSIDVSDWKNYDDAYIILKSERTENSTVIKTNSGLIVHDYPYAFAVAYYDVSELSGYVKIKTTKINSGVSLYSLMDADNNVIAFSDKGTDVISEAFVNVTNGATLCVQFGVQTPCSVEYFNNDAITKLFNLINSAEKNLPVKNETNLITSGAVYSALHRVLSGTNYAGKYINYNDGSIVSSQYGSFVITEYDVTGLTGFAHLTTSFLHASVSLYSLQDENGNVISFSNKPTTQIADIFIDITLGTKLYVTSVSAVEFFDNDAITELFKRVINIESDFDDISQTLDAELTTVKSDIVSVQKEAVYDVSAHNDGAVFESLQALLSSSNLSTLIPPAVRCGGMSIRFIQGSVPNSDNKYVQYRLMADSWSIDVSDWKNYDDAYIILKSERTENSTVIKTNSGLIVHDYPYAFAVAYYDVSELSGYVKIKTTKINSGVSLYSLMDADNNVIAFSDKGTDVISEAFVNVTNGATLCVQFGVQTPCSVEYFNNDAITKLFNLINSAEKNLPVKNETNLITSGAVYSALHRVLSGTNYAGKYINYNDGSIVSSQYGSFVITEYDVTGLTGFAHLTTSFLHASVSLYSLQDENGNVISFSNKPTTQIADIFIDITLGTKLYVTSVSAVEFFDNDAITELFKRVINIESDFDDFTGNIENLQNVNVDMSQYIKFGKRVDTTGEVTDNNYAYIKLPVSLLTVSKTYYFKGKSAQYVPGVIVQRGEVYFVATYGDDISYTIKDTDTYININLNKVYGNLGIALSSYKVAEINKEVYSKSQTEDKIDELINSVTEGTEYNIIEENCEFFINKRYISTPNTPVQPPVDANGYVCARFTNIDVTKIYAADCISSQYVPGYMLLDENDIILAQGDPYGSVVYNKQILPIKDSSYKTVLLQAKVDTTNVNELTVKNILRLFIKENIKSVYSSGEIDNKLYQRDVKIKNLEDTQITEEEYKLNQNPWFGKSIAWFGTSIPEGGVWAGGPTYPNKVGKMLGAVSTHNEAVGGSCAANKVSGYTTFQYWYIRMGHSVAQNIDLFRDAYTVDYTNQTVSSGPRTMIADLHLSSIPTVTTYSQAVDLLASMVGCSYEIKLVYRYLISDETESENYLNRIFAGYSNELTALKNISQSSNYKNILYQYDIDLIVFDHGHNDGPAPIDNADFYDANTNGIDTTDMTTWLGAMNTYMRLVMFYKPKMRVVQISDYYYGNTVKSQEQFARRWQIPYCEVWKSLPYLYNRFKVTVRGYWDANGIWHDKGFTWTEPTNMSDTNIANYTNLSANAYELASAGGYGTGTIGALKVNINPRQENGEWVWETNLSNIFMKDGLHPGSDYTWKCVDLYARVLVKFMKGV